MIDLTVLIFVFRFALFRMIEALQRCHDVEINVLFSSGEGYEEMFEEMFDIRFSWEFSNKY
jgi:hypothetical protein